jgi:hypothetical protein
MGFEPEVCNGLTTGKKIKKKSNQILKKIKKKSIQIFKKIKK